MTPAELLEQLRGIHLPAVAGEQPVAAMSIWPLLGTALTIGLVALLIWWRARAWRRQALRELNSIARHARRGERAMGWQRLSVLLRQLTLHLNPEPAAVHSAGEPWLKLLDQTLGTECFASGPGRSLLEAPYRAEASGVAEDLLAVVDTVRRRVPRLKGRR